MNICLIVLLWFLFLWNYNLSTYACLIGECNSNCVVIYCIEVGVCNNFRWLTIWFSGYIVASPHFCLLIPPMWGVAASMFILPFLSSLFSKLFIFFLIYCRSWGPTGGLIFLLVVVVLLHRVRCTPWVFDSVIRVHGCVCAWKCALVKPNSTLIPAVGSLSPCWYYCFCFTYTYTNTYYLKLVLFDIFFPFCNLCSCVWSGVSCIFLFHCFVF